MAACSGHAAHPRHSFAKLCTVQVKLDLLLAGVPDFVADCKRMGGKRHTGIGYNRARKTKVPKVAAAQQMSLDDCEPPGPAPAPSPVPAQVRQVMAAVAVAAAPEQEPKPALMQPVEIVDDLLAKLAEAKANLAKAERSWEKTKLTYSNHEQHSLFDCRSVVERDDARLLAADQQLGEARALLVWHSDRYSRHRTYFRFAERLLDRPCDAVTRVFYERAYRRVMIAPRVPSWESMWPGIRAGNIWDWNARNYGLCLTRGLTEVRRP